MAHIIIADDDPIVGQLVRRLLEAEGHAVGWAQDGRAALDAIRCKRPDLVILDCAMPRMPGLDVLRQMRSAADLRRIPVVMLTARRGRQDVDVAIYTGADAYVKKPIDADQLLFWTEELLLNGRRGVAGLSA